MAISQAISKTQKIAIFNFDQLCRFELAASDYQAICKNFDLIFLLKVPKLTSEDVNEARRFVLFIDEVYENKTALIVLAKTKLEKIYESKIGSEAFARTVSRLNEIKSDQYWQESKVNFK
jgi:cell division protein ZapE